MSRVKNVLKTISLDLSDIPRRDRAEAKKEVGDLIIEEILRHVGDGKSPVQDHGRFKSLSKEYAKEFKGGDRTATLQLFGDLLDSLEARDEGGAKISIGHKGAQAPKADGHNQLSGEAKSWAAGRNFPRRRYIPAKDEDFKNSIMRKADKILNSYRVKEERLDVDIDEVNQGFDDITGDLINVGINELFSEDILKSLLTDALRRRI